MGAGTTSLPLVGERGQVEGEGARLKRRVGRRIEIAQILAGGCGAIDVFLLLWIVLPLPDIDGDVGRVVLLNGILLAAFLSVGAIAGLHAGNRAFRDIERWLTEERAPTRDELRATLDGPLRCAVIDAVGWGVGAVLFFLVNLPVSAHVAAHVALTIAMGGITTTAVAYLLTERMMRPITARALSYGPPQRSRGPGVAGRLLLAWISATAVPLLGLVLVAWHVLVDDGVTAAETARSVLVLSALALMVGALATYLVARSIADPLTSVRRALARIAEGDLDARVPVWDGSEVGLVQSGFNQMASGLAERERLRDLFGRHVGEDVAREALARGDVRLGGEVREVAVLFVDLIGSTALASRRPPRDVVRLLNDFFAVVVDVSERHGGWVNKFEGDAALVVFGAPGDHEDAAGAALAASRELRRRLHVLRGVDAAIGVSAGPAVAGNVGAERRFEYTVIGDPVNEAARLCELAKQRDERLLASASVLGRSRNGEADRWTACEQVRLRGRQRPTTVCVPA